jgi:drug/metabolite transporter (DMT)-like permease
MAIRVGVGTVPPLLLAAVRYLIAGAILFPLAWRAGSPELRATDRPRAAHWGSAAVVGILLLLGGNGGVSVGERTVPSGFASLLVATVPLWLLIIDAAVNRARVGLLAVLGLLAGLAGVALLAGIGGSGSRGGASGSGVAIILVAALSWALGTIASGRLLAPQRPMLYTAMQMLAGGAALLALAAATGEFASFHLGQVSLGAWLALAYLIGPGSILALSAYSVAVRKLPTPTVATYAYVNPVVAVFLGTTFLSEAVTPGMLLGGGLIIIAVALVVRRRPAVH